MGDRRNGDRSESPRNGVDAKSRPCLRDTRRAIPRRRGIASGRAVAGVIGRRKFAYDLWGDTVNLASRLESNGEPGRILVAEATAARLAGRYAFGPPQLIELKGKGPTAARFLLGRR